MEIFNRTDGAGGQAPDDGIDETVDPSPTTDGSDMKTRATLYLATVYVFICVIGLAANAAVLYMIARSRRSKAVTNIYIFNLALADLLYAVCLPAAVYQMLNGQWTFGHMMCKFYYTCDGVSKFASVMFLVILSFDRYVAVCHPIRCRAVRTAKLAFATTGSAWTVVILAMVPVFLHATLLQVTETDTETYQCVIYWPPSNQGNSANSINDSEIIFQNGSIDQNETDDSNGYAPELSSWNRRIFTLYLFTLSFLTPLAMVWIFYTMILLRLWAQKRRLFSSNAASAKEPTGSSAAHDDDHEDLDENRTSLRQKRPMLPAQIPPPTVNAASQRRTRSTRRVTIMVLSIVICYTLCWIPFWTIQLTIEFFPDAVQAIFTIEVFTIISYIAYGMQSVNSMLNPFLYAFGTQTHRRRIFARYRRIFGLVGCRWRFFGIGSPPPRGRAHSRTGEMGTADSCMLRRPTDTQRHSEISYFNNTNAKDDQAVFAYCLCCYCEPTPDSCGGEKSKKPAPVTMKIPTGRTMGVKEALSKDFHDDDEEE